MKDEKNRNDLIVRYLSNECSQEEVNELLSWIKESVDNERYLNDFRYTWIASHQLKPVDSGKIEDATVEFRNRILKSFRDEKTYKNSSVVNILRVVSKRFLKYAAIVLTAFFLGMLAKSFFGNKIQSGKISDYKYFSFESPKGSRSIATLPDGTKVWLNASSKISYSLDYNVVERIILLEGEAYFDVATNPSKPFVVKASNLNIKAFGTMFNVKAYPEENQVITTLLEGKVTIEGTDKTNKKFSLQMDPNQCVTYNTGNKSVADPKQEATNKKVDNISVDKEKSPLKPTVIPLEKRTLVEPEINTSWKDERWIIANEDLESLSVMLERRFNVNIRFIDEESKAYHFTGIIENETIEQVLKILSLTVPVKYNIDRNNVELVLNDKLKNTYINALKSNSSLKPISN